MCKLLAKLSTPCLKKLCKIVFCQNFVKFPPILIIFGKQMAKRLKLCEVYSFFTSSNSRHHNTDMTQIIRSTHEISINKNLTKNDKILASHTESGFLTSYRAVFYYAIIFIAVWITYSDIAISIAFCCSSLQIKNMFCIVRCALGPLLNFIF